MDKNTILAMVLMLLTLFGFQYFNTPSQQELEARRKYVDSVNTALALQNEMKAKAAAEADSVQKALMHDSAAVANKYGAFASSANGSEKSVVLENNLVKVELSSLGGSVKKVTVKNYNDFKGQPLVLFDETDNYFNIELPAANGNVINTSDMYFVPSDVTDSTATFTLTAGDNAGFAFIYRLPADSYMMNFDIKSDNLRSLLSSKSTTKLDWNTKIRQHEKSIKFESRYASLSYKLFDDSSVEDLSNTGVEEENVEEPLRWVAFKDQFFSAVLISDGKGIKNANLVSSVQQPNTGYLQSYKAEMQVDHDMTTNQVSNFRFFFGPNKYSLLRSYDNDLSGDEKLKLNRLIPLGLALFRWVNQLIVIPMFNFFGSFISNYGLIIFLMTLVIKLIIFPFTRSSYMSSAKMRVLKPEIEKLIKERNIPEDDMMARQQVSSEVYGKAGVNPMGGCLPMLLQMPFLFAMFTFFPTAIELRGQSFLWADDLSSYDAIVSWSTHIPLVSDYFGNHVSLFCLLMTITNIVFTKFNMSATDTGANPQMASMKYMMYFMPIMFLFFFNEYASGLTYYYFISTLMSIAQTLGMKYFIDEEKVLAKIHEKSKNRSMSQSSWMARLAKMQEEMQKMQEEQRRQQQNNK